MATNRANISTTRTSIRPRPVDINKQLTIVRDIGELDTTDGLKEEPQQAAAGSSHAPPELSYPTSGVSGRVMEL